MASAKMTYGAASSSSHQWTYDVFLSFYGQDTRKNFTDYLFNELVRDGIHTFRDDEDLNKRENDISSELMEAMEGSRIAVIVFSKHYASLTQCLNVLVKILECQKDGRKEKVLPVFYKVDPSDVRHQCNTYAEAFKGHEESFKDEMEKVKMWRAALQEAVNFSGWNHIHVTNGHEAEFTKKIVKDVLAIVNIKHLDVVAYPMIGLDVHIERIAGCLLKGGLDVVRIIGIYGSSGMGKTTIAKAIFNDMFKKFEGSSFLTNVEEASSLVSLQAQLLSDILKGRDINIYNENQGIIIIKEHLFDKRVLIVLDDMEKMEQFYKLVRERDWFGPGSRIILTTKNEHLLNELDVDEKYVINKMNQNDSLQLFSCHAFRQKHPLEGYVQLSKDVIGYVEGLPLALVILGSLLYKRSRDEWEIELKKLRKIPNGHILEILEISYDGLEDFNRTIFLDISCFFIGKHKNYVTAILDACGLGGEAGIKFLKERSLITIDEDNRLCMHDLIRDMGREIVHKQSLQNPGKRSRLWDLDDAVDVLINLTGTDAVEGFQLGSYDCRKFSTGFSKMSNLRLLEVDHFYDINFDGAHSFQKQVFCFRNLFWVSWKNFPLSYIPNNFHMENIVILDMQWSRLIEVWEETKYLTKLKELNLTDSFLLTSTPDFSGLPNLEKLILSYCTQLVEVHESIGLLKKLVNLDLHKCIKLKNLPISMSKLASLEILDIFECSKIKKLPERIGNLKRLTVLDTRGTAIEELPISFGLLKNLSTYKHSLPDYQGMVYLCQITNSEVPTPIPIRGAVSLHGCCSLKHLTLKHFNLRDDDIPHDFWMLFSLESLDLSRNNFESIPSSICQLSKLQTLSLLGCHNLKTLPMLPSSLCSLVASYSGKLKRLPNLSNLKHLTTLNLSGCNELEKLPNLSNLKHLPELDVSYSEKLTVIEGLESLKSATTIKLNMCHNLEMKRFFQDLSHRDFGNHKVCNIFFCCKEVPEWFEFQSEIDPRRPDSLSCQATQLLNKEIRGLIIFLVFTRPSGQWIHRYSIDEGVMVLNESKDVKWRHESEIPIDGRGRTNWVIKIPNCVWKSIGAYGDIINVSQRKPFRQVRVKNIGVHFFYE